MKKIIIFTLYPCCNSLASEDLRATPIQRRRGQGAAIGGPSIDACTGVSPRRRSRSLACFVSSFNELQRVSVQSRQSTRVALALPRESHGLSLAAKERSGLMARCQMTMPDTIVFMRLPQLDSDEIQLTMTHAPFGDDLLGELPNFLRGTL